MIIAQSDAHNFNAALNNNGLQPIRSRSVEAFQRTDVDSTDYDLMLVEPRSVQRSYNCADVAHTHTSPPDAQLYFPHIDISSDRVLRHQAAQQFLLNCLHVHRHETALIAPR